MGPSDFATQAPVPRMGSRMKPSLAFDQILAGSPGSNAIRAAIEALRSKDGTGNNPQEEQPDTKRRKIGEGSSLKHSFDGTSSSPAVTFKPFTRPEVPETTTLPTPVSSSIARESVSSPPNAAKPQPPYFQALAHLSGAVNVYTPASHFGNAVPQTFHNPPPPTSERTPHVTPKPAEGLENRTPKAASPKPPPATTNTLSTQKPTPKTKRKLADITELRETETVTPRGTAQEQQDSQPTPTTRRKSARTSMPSEKAVQAGLSVEADDKRLETRRQSTRSSRTEPAKPIEKPAEKPVKLVKPVAKSAEKPTEKQPAGNMQNSQEYELKFSLAIYDHEDDDSDSDIIRARPKRTGQTATKHTPLKQSKVFGPASGMEATPPMEAVKPAEKKTSTKVGGKATATPNAVPKENQSLPKKRPAEAPPAAPDSGRRSSGRINEPALTTASSSKPVKDTTKTPAKQINKPSTKEKSVAAANPTPSVSNSNSAIKNPLPLSETPAAAPAKKGRKSYPETPAPAPASARSTRSTGKLMKVPEMPDVVPPGIASAVGSSNGSKLGSGQNRTPRREVPETPQTEPQAKKARTRSSLGTSKIPSVESPAASTDTPAVPAAKRGRKSVSTSETTMVVEEAATPAAVPRMKKMWSSRKTLVKNVLPPSSTKPSKVPAKTIPKLPILTPTPIQEKSIPGRISRLPPTLSPSSKESMKFSTTGGADRLYKIPAQILAVTGSVRDETGRRVSGRRHTAGAEVLEALRMGMDRERVQKGGTKSKERRKSAGVVKSKEGATRRKSTGGVKEKEKEKQKEQKEVRYDFSDEE
ncbi:Protein of unknown function [Pyronema omphalodes CBS 100304]|uniref:Uncharacterized protein n=1 Tax=Pyronema omphalodes (strain CBS 100304) TaxID=1076935 RepID=U4L245_PYROM|nr:Protein of unknown function [Pyronema omphalodes CBS 100304]